MAVITGYIDSKSQEKKASDKVWEKARGLYTGENGELLQTVQIYTLAQYTVCIEGQLWERQGEEAGKRRREEKQRRSREEREGRKGGRRGRKERQGGEGGRRGKEEREGREAGRRGRKERQGGEGGKRGREEREGREVGRRETLGHTGHIYVCMLHTYML